MNRHLSVVVKPTLDCNESCRHCYSNGHRETVPASMPEETVDRLMRLVSEEYESAWFIWHGGEPMTLPMSFFRSAIGSEERWFGKGTFRVGNTIQTNGTLLNRRFMAFCREKRINVGVSSEGPYNRVLRELDPESAIERLSAKENRYSVSATVSSATALRQRELYEYYRGRGTNLSLTPVVDTGCPGCSALVPDPDEYIRGSIEAFDAWFRDPESRIPLIPHYLYILNYLGDPTPSDCAHSSCLTRWISVDPDGELYPCAKACPEEFRLGNINDLERISDAFRSEGFRRILQGSVERRERCGSCPVYANCNGGCSIDAYYQGGLRENGGDSCRIFREVFSHIASEVQAVMDGREDVSGLNPFVRDAIVGRLVNPRDLRRRPMPSFSYGVS